MTNKNEEIKENPFKEEEIKENPFEEKKVEENSEETMVDEQVSEEESIEAKLKAEIEDLNNKYLRLAADFDNFRKRQATEKENLIKYAGAETLTKLIDVLDNFDRAQEQVQKYDDCATVKDCYEVAIKQFKDTLSKIGLEKIETENQQFDPNFHEAISQTPTSEVEEGTIVSQMRAGYKLKDRVLRPAMVSVAVSEG